MHKNQVDAHLSGDAPLHERRRGDRRSQVLRALLQGNLRPRRYGPRRASERAITAVDWHHPQWLAVAVLIVLLSCLDAGLTLSLIAHDLADEWNPLMAPLVGGSPLRFAAIKIGLTAAGVIMLTQLSRLRTFGRVPAGAFLYGVLALYGVLVSYEYWLLNSI
ncbi:MAG: hypothetical protein JO341_08865 [Gammaproteobacteria bacterium]|nr:hypothetical protein [Gammaproteobacteria bacterium]MBV9621120.1 hypothetical protein [Gammaproteobacteria bacterium]